MILSDSNIIRAHVAATHQAVIVKLPMLIAMSAIPLPAFVVPLVFKADGDAVVGISQLVVACAAAGYSRL